MAAYCTAEQVEAYLGVTFTVEQTLQVEQLNLAVGAFIDRYTGQTWDPDATTIVNEQHALSTATIYLYAPPVETVDAVAVRPASGGGAWTTLDPSQYELVDPSSGAVAVYGYAGSTGRFDYTRDVVPLPPDVELAAIMLAAQQTARVVAVQQAAALLTTTPELAGLESISVGQNDVTVKRSTAGDGSTVAGSSWAAVGSAVRAILDGHKVVVIA